jgi:hypothetical protein
MRCTVTKRFKSDGEFHPVGSIMDIPENMILKMAGFIQTIGNADGYPDQPITGITGIESPCPPAEVPTRQIMPLYCVSGNCSCSTLLPGNDYPGDCIRISCEYYDSDIPPLPVTQSTTVETCKAVKTRGRICGAPLRTGFKGFRSCSDRTCQVPAQ